MVKYAIRMSGCGIAGYKCLQLFAPFQASRAEEPPPTNWRSWREGVISREETATKSLKHSCHAAPCGASTAHHKYFQQECHRNNPSLLNGFNRKCENNLGTDTDSALICDMKVSLQVAVSMEKRGI